MEPPYIIVIPLQLLERRTILNLEGGYRERGEGSERDCVRVKERD